jgi:hypothetical protein
MMMEEVPLDQPGSPGKLEDTSPREAQCSHAKTRVEKSYSGNFLVLRTICEACDRIVKEENVLLGLEQFRCPVDPRLDRCYLSCPVEDGSLGVFENPCEPVRKVLEATGYIAPLSKPEPAPVDTTK